MQRDRDVNIFDIAKLAGVGTSTVSRVLNGHPNVSEKTRARVQQAIKEYTYIPNNSARNLSRTSSRAVGVVVSGVTNPFFSRMISVIQSELVKNQYAMILQNHNPDSKTDIADTALSLFKEKRPMGLLFLGGNFDHNHQKLRSIDTPVALATTTIHSECERSWYSSVTIDDEHEVFEIASYIFKNGHKRVAIIGSHGLRARGFDQAMRVFGLNATKVNIEHEPAFSFKTGYLAAKKLLEIGSYTCVFCYSDILAIGALKAIRESGLNIPNDISVLGFDGIELSEYTNPALTTVKQPSDDIARQSVSTLLSTINTGAPCAHIILPTTLVEGESFRPFGG